MNSFDHKIEHLILLILASPLLCASLALMLRKFKTYISIPIFIISFFSSLVTLIVIKTFFSLGIGFVNIELFYGVVINLEPINLIFITMVSFLWSMTNLYSISYLNMNKEIIAVKFYLFLSLSIFCTFCIALAPNLIVLFVFYEFLSLSTYPLVSHLGGDEERKSSRVYLYTLIGASVVFFLPAILYLMSHIGHTTFAVGGIANFLPGNVVTVLFILFLYGVAKSAIVPMHFWLPKAMVASFPVSAVLHAVAVVKSGIFIMIKISVYIFGLKYLRENISEFFHANIITILCTVSLLISSVIALYQTRIKSLLAYSTINQLSICLLALSMFHPLAVKAAVIHMVSHALGKITLFFASGYVYCNSRISDLKDFKGLGKKMKFIMALFTIAALSIIGLPIFGGFISKAYIYYAALYKSVNYLVLISLTISVLMTAHYFIKILYSIYDQKSFISHKKEEEYEHKLLSSMTLAILFTSCGTVFYVFIYEYILMLMDLVEY
jgi:multicomponent Na+:H+ antiporter subunit D